jgi:putative transposase
VGHLGETRSDTGGEGDSGRKQTRLVRGSARLPARRRARTAAIHRCIVYHGRKGQKKGFDENDYIRLLDAAHEQLRGPIVLVWDNINTPP